MPKSIGRVIIERFKQKIRLK